MSSGLDTTASRPFDRPGDEPFQHPTGNIRAHGLAQYSPKSAEAFSIPVPATTTKHDISPLFQIPQLPLAPICPQRWPGIDAESTKMLLKVLEDNHCRWHIFFNYKGFHKCASRFHAYITLRSHSLGFEAIRPITSSRFGRWARARISLFPLMKLIASINVLRLTRRAILRAITLTSTLAMNGKWGCCCAVLV
jgi:hypothetical protein